MSLAVQDRYGPSTVLITDSGDTEIAAAQAGHVCIVHRLILSNENAAARTVTIEPTGGSVSLSITLAAESTIDLDELNHKPAEAGNSLTLNISDTDVSAYVEYSFRKVG